MPNLSGTKLGPVGSSDLDSVFVASLNLILDDVRLVIVNFDAHLVQVELVPDDLCEE